MKIFVCGQKSFSVAVCKELKCRGHEIIGVAPPPQEKYYDKLQGYALKEKIPIVSDCDSLVSDLIPNDTDLIIAAHSHWLISDKCIAKTKYGGVGFHPSLLPRHKGRDAVRWAVHMGDYVTGATTYVLDDKTDGGDILMQELVWIDPSWDYHKLWNVIFPIGVRLVADTVDGIEKGTLHPKPQNSQFETFEPSWERKRLKRNELIQIGGEAPEVGECPYNCESCVMHLSDPDYYYRGSSKCGGGQ